MALEAAAMRGCGGVSKGVFDRYGRQMLRHDERSLLPLVREFDASGDGVLRLSEFRLLLALRFGEVGREPPAMAEATRLFKAAVRDDNGRLGIDELAKILDVFGGGSDRRGSGRDDARARSRSPNGSNLTARGRASFKNV